MFIYNHTDTDIKDAVKLNDTFSFSESNHCLPNIYVSITTNNSQLEVKYHQSETIVDMNDINQALHILGVKCESKNEFETLGLSRFF